MYEHYCHRKGFYCCHQCMRETVLGMKEQKELIEYRKTIPLDTSTDYWFVEMGELNFLNGGSNYPFPTLEAAERFAINHKRIALQQYGVDRDIAIRYPDGTIKPVPYEED